MEVLKMYHCETENLRGGGTIVKAFDKDDQLVGIGAYFGDDDCCMHMHKKITSPQDQSKLKQAIVEACPYANWVLDKPSAAKG